MCLLKIKKSLKDCHKDLSSDAPSTNPSESRDLLSEYRRIVIGTLTTKHAIDLIRKLRCYLGGTVRASSHSAAMTRELSPSCDICTCHSPQPCGQMLVELERNLMGSLKSSSYSRSQNNEILNSYCEFTMEEPTGSESEEATLGRAQGRRSLTSEQHSCVVIAQYINFTPQF